MTYSYTGVIPFGWLKGVIGENKVTPWLQTETRPFQSSPEKKKSTNPHFVHYLSFSIFFLFAFFDQFSNNLMIVSVRCLGVKLFGKYLSRSSILMDIFCL